MKFISALYQRGRNQSGLIIGLLLTTPIIFFQSLRYKFPLGYAGMFTLIAENIARASFVLPMNVPHYGPGGIPLVYPPLAMYVFAVAINTGVSTWAYLRFAPALFALLSVIPLYYLTLELVESKVASVIAVVLVMTAPAVYYTHVWSAGVVRGLALFFCLSGLLFYVRAIKDFSWRNVLLAGFFLGLLLVTHWLYIIFAALAGLAYLVSVWRPRRILFAASVLAVALLVAAPWLIVILERHGLSSVLMAYSSHRNFDFVLSLQEISTAIRFVGGNLGHLATNWFVAALALLGFVLFLFRRKFHLPLAFVLILFMGEASFYTDILAGMLAGAFSAEVFHYVSKHLASKPGVRSYFFSIGLDGVSLMLVVAAIVSGLQSIVQYEPEIDTDSLKMAAFVRNNTRPDAAYLFVGTINEAEWFPYLMDRTPVFALWGSEWKGTYAQQLEILVALRECQLQKSWACMESIQLENGVSPALLVIPNQRWLVSQIKDTHAWELIYSNDRYRVWKRFD